MICQRHAPCWAGGFNGQNDRRHCRGRAFVFFAQSFQRRTFRRLDFCRAHGAVGIEQVAFAQTRFDDLFNIAIGVFRISEAWPLQGMLQELNFAGEILEISPKEAFAIIVGVMRCTP